MITIFKDRHSGMDCRNPGSMDGFKPASMTLDTRCKSHRAIKSMANHPLFRKKHYSVYFVINDLQMLFSKIKAYHKKTGHITLK
jgi:hypothetical protein